MTAPPWMRVSSRWSQSSFRSLRIVCGVTSKRADSSSTITRPAERATRISVPGEGWEGRTRWIQTRFSRHRRGRALPGRIPSVSELARPFDRPIYTVFASAACEIRALREARWPAAAYPRDRRSRASADSLLGDRHRFPRAERPLATTSVHRQPFLLCGAGRASSS